MRIDSQVLIVGAGPAGLTAAIELARRGIRCRILERKAAPLATSNALVVQPRTLEIWHEEDVINEALTQGIKIQAMNMYVRNNRLARIEFAQLDTQYPFQLALPQSESERLLARRLQGMAVTVERVREVVDLKQNESSVSVIAHREDGTDEVISAEWVIACDGAHSTVREKLGLRFVGSDLEERFIMADLPLQWPMPGNESHVFLSSRGACGVITLNGYSRIIFEVTHEKDLATEKNPTLDNFKRLAKERCPVAIEFGAPLWISSLWTHQKISSSYRINRVFLAGDAAHVHSPVGGQGMNTSVQDAYNLAWKLALVLQGRAQLPLLDSYEQERRPIAQRVLKQTTVMTRLIGLRNPVAQRARNAVFRILFGNQKGARRQSQQVSNLAVRYRRSEITGQDVQRRFRTGLRPGDRAPFATRFPTSQVALLVFTGTKADGELGTQLYQLAERVKQDFAGLVDIFLIRHKSTNAACQSEAIEDADGELHDSFGVKTPSIYLLRPDKHIGFRGSPSDLGQLRNYLTDFVHLRGCAHEQVRVKQPVVSSQDGSHLSAEISG